MARYIDADKADVEQIDCYYGAHCTLHDVQYWLEEQPTADVVPKSEVEMLQGALKAEERHNELTMEMAQKALKNAKAEVARGIFAEIEREIELALKSNYAAKKVRIDKTNATTFVNIVDGKITALRGLEDFIAELKKKYTGDQK